MSSILGNIIISPIESMGTIAKTSSIKVEGGQSPKFMEKTEVAAKNPMSNIYFYSG